MSLVLLVSASFSSLWLVAMIAPKPGRGALSAGGSRPGIVRPQTALRLVNEAVGMEKLTILAGFVDTFRDDFENFRREVRIDDEIETLNLSDLSKQYGVAERTLRDQIERRLGKGSVIKVGKKWVIRKRRFLDFLNHEESRGEDR